MKLNERARGSDVTAAAERESSGRTTKEESLEPIWIQYAAALIGTERRNRSRGANKRETVEGARWVEGKEDGEGERERAIRGDSKCRLMWSHTMQPHTDRIRNRAKRSLRPLVGSMNERSRGEARSNFHADLPPPFVPRISNSPLIDKREKKRKHWRNEKETCYGIIESIIGSFRNNLSRIVVDYER